MLPVWRERIARRSREERTTILPGVVSCLSTFYIPMFVWEKDRTAVLTQRMNAKSSWWVPSLGELADGMAHQNQHVPTNNHSAFTTRLGIRKPCTNLRLNPAFATTQHRCIPPTTCQSAHCSCPAKIHQMLNTCSMNESTDFVCVSTPIPIYLRINTCP